jgi:glycosyltransferase involved in cell wall biosynthesis
MYADVELVIMGSTRHDEDIRLLDSLRDEVTTLGLQDHVRFVANAPYSELQRYMQQALIGLHTMWNEHFGISIVEMMAAGLIVVAHNSGGPRLDIVPNSAGNADLANGKADCCSMLFDDVLDIPQPCCKCLQRANTRHSLFEGGATTESRRC